MSSLAGIRTAAVDSSSEKYKNGSALHVAGLIPCAAVMADFEARPLAWGQLLFGKLTPRRGGHFFVSTHRLESHDSNFLDLRCVAAAAAAVFVI